MLNEKDARYESLKRIADTLRISVDDLYSFGEDFIKFELIECYNCGSI